MLSSLQHSGHRQITQHAREPMFRCYFDPIPCCDHTCKGTKLQQSKALTRSVIQGLLIMVPAICQPVAVVDSMVRLAILLGACASILHPTMPAAATKQFLVHPAHARLSPCKGVDSGSSLATSHCCTCLLHGFACILIIVRFVSTEWIGGHLCLCELLMESWTD